MISALRDRFGRRRAHPSPGSRDSGQVTLFVLVLAAGALLVVSLVYFQGVKLRAAREAANLAEEAARAGAGQLNRDRLYRTGVTTVDPAAAIRQARAYLTAAGTTGTVTTTADRRVHVTVTVTRPAPLLSAIGVSSISVTRTASADLITGVQGEGR